MKVVQDLVAYFDRRGKLSRREMRKILHEGHVATDAPNGMHGLCDVVGAIYYFRITGVSEGQVWGTDTYTRDSTLGAAAVHAGLVKPGETAVLRVTIVPPLSSYSGTTRHGVTTTDYGEFPHAWTLSAI
ncbi:LCCL domain containing protein [Rhabdaerophilaceae bacterium]